ncbi:MAG: ferritin family protein [Candidatus Omnitrophota bacterium]|nr:ferritin family protein [Candidatus Omnitrophota bacterium]
MVVPLEVLQIALGKEKEAYKFYEEMLAKHSSSVIKDILISLKDAEYKHEKIIEEKISEINKSF